MKDSPDLFPPPLSLSNPFLERSVSWLTLGLFFLILNIYLVNPSYHKIPQWLSHDPLAAWMEKTLAQTIHEDILIQVNSLTPNFAPLQQWVVTNETSLHIKPDTTSLQSYKNYFDAVSRLFPQNPEGYEILAYILALDGRYDLAIKKYQEAYNLNANSFWTNYNLALLYGKEEDWGNAQLHLNEALLINPQDTLRKMTNSKAYANILRPLLSEDFIRQRILMAQKDILILQKILQSNLPPETKETILATLPPKLF